MQKLATIALVIPLMGCATTGKALSVAACGINDSRLGLVVRDPAAVIEYFKHVLEEGRRIVAAAKIGEPVAEDVAEWVGDQLDLIDRMRRCIPRETAVKIERVLRDVGRI